MSWISLLFLLGPSANASPCRLLVSDFVRSGDFVETGYGYTLHAKEACEDWRPGVIHLRDAVLKVRKEGKWIATFRSKSTYIDENHREIITGALISSVTALKGFQQAPFVALDLCNGVLQAPLGGHLVIMREAARSKVCMGRES